MNRDSLNVNGLLVGSDNPVRIMGVINLSPESFYSGSIVADETTLVTRVEEMIFQGVDILDIGSASTAPKEYYDTKSTRVDDELDRISTTLDTVRKTASVPISIDTTSSLVAETALSLGASIVDDVSGLQADEKMARLVADQGVPVVIMANCSGFCDSTEASLRVLRRSLQIADRAGIPEENIILDPVVGFGKPPEVDYALLRELGRFKQRRYS